MPKVVPLAPTKSHSRTICKQRQQLAKIGVTATNKEPFFGTKAAMMLTTVNPTVTSFQTNLNNQVCHYPLTNDHGFQCHLAGPM
jgi:hypothetical protein